MKPIPTPDNVPTELMRIGHRLEQERIVHSDDAFWVMAGALVVRNLQGNLQQALEILNRAISERDEARREVCELRCNPPEPFIGLPHELARINGWDCCDSVTVAGEVERE